MDDKSLLFIMRKRRNLLWTNKKYSRKMEKSAVIEEVAAFFLRHFSNIITYLSGHRHAPIWFLYQKSDRRKDKWLITRQVKNESGIIGKNRKKRNMRELGMEEEKIQKLRQMDREDFLEERRYREHLGETMQDMDSIKEKDSELFARDVKELLDHIGDKRIYELLKETEHQTLEILLLSTWGYSGTGSC